MRRKCGTGALLALVLLVAGCAPADLNTILYSNVFRIRDPEPVVKEAGAGETRDEAAEEAAAEEAREEQEALSENPVKDPEEAEEIILNRCSAEFIAAYPLDETFLSWFYARFGEETLEAVATAVKNDYRDPDLWYHLTGETIHVLWAEFCRDTGFQQDKIANCYWLPCASEDEIVMDFSGDINFCDGCGCMNYLAAQGSGIADCFSDDLMEEMRGADLMMFNNEFTYSTRGEPLPGKPYTFRANPENVKLLEDLGADIVGLANNHVYDYGEEALLDTLDTLERAEMPYVGAGRNLSEAEQPVYFIMNGRKIAITAATQIERSLNYTKQATEDKPGVLKTLDPALYVEVLKEAEKQADIVVAFVHWGTEGNVHFEGDQQALAQAFVAAGADVIIGGHTHCLQGISYVEGVPVIYSLGNFWFSSTPNDGKAAKDTGLAQVRIDAEDQITFRFLPCRQENYRTVLYTEGVEKERILRDMEKLSSGITLDENGVVHPND